MLLLKSKLFVTSQLRFINPQNIYQTVNILYVWQTHADLWKFLILKFSNFPRPRFVKWADMILSQLARYIPLPISGPPQFKETFQAWDFHYKDKTVTRPSYLYNENSSTGETTTGPETCWDLLIDYDVQMPLELHTSMLRDYIFV